MSKVKERKLFADRETRVVFTANGSIDKSRCDPTFAEDSQIKNMLIKFARGEVHQREPFYADVSEYGDFRAVQERVIHLRSEFDKLPSEVRNLCENDPSNLPSVISDPKNKEFLEKVGFFKQASEGRSGGSEGTPDAGSGVQPQKGAQAPKNDATASNGEP